MKKEKKKITYLLGAGASANAIPVMKSLPKAMKYFFEKLVYSVRNNSSLLDQIESRRAYFNDLLEEINRFGTPDIVAKIAFYKGDTEKLEDIKNLLACYILSEQLEPDIHQAVENMDDGNMDFIEKLKGDLFGDIAEIGKYLIPSQLDNRYIEFFSAILKGKDESLTFPDNIHILSWNYDHQIEKALDVFYGKSLPELQEHFRIFPITNFADSLLDYDRTFKEIFESKVVKLNGTAGYSNENYRKSLIDINKHSFDSRIMTMFASTIFKTRSNKFEENKVAFAWETESSRSRLAIETSTHKMQYSDTVVVIGYSFPNFNREVDREVFRLFKGSKIYIQDLYPDEIIQKLDGVLPGLKGKAIPVKSSGAFTLPNEFWE